VRDRGSVEIRRPHARGGLTYVFVPVERGNVERGPPVAVHSVGWRIVLMEDLQPTIRRVRGDNQRDEDIALRTCTQFCFPECAARCMHVLPSGRRTLMSAFCSRSLVIAVSPPMVHSSMSFSSSFFASPLWTSVAVRGAGHEARGRSATPGENESSAHPRELQPLFIPLARLSQHARLSHRLSLLLLCHWPQKLVMNRTNSS